MGPTPPVFFLFPLKTLKNPAAEILQAEEVLRQLFLSTYYLKYNLIWFNMTLLEFLNILYSFIPFVAHKNYRRK